MKKITLLALCMSLFVGLATASTDWEELSGVGYAITEKGYLAAPKQVRDGIVATNSRHNELYLLKNNQLKTLVATPGCGRYTNLNYDKTLVGYKSINEYGDQAPAILEVATGKVTLLEEYTNQCGQVSFSNDGTIAYTYENELIINRNGMKTRYEIGYHTNIVNIAPDGKSVAFTDNDGKPVIMDLTTRKQLYLAEMGGVYNPKWSPDGKKLVLEADNRTLYVYDATRKKFNYLTKGTAAQWLSDSENLVFTTAEYENDDAFKFKGTSVNQMSYDGKVKRVLVATSKECPQEVGVLDGDRIAISYAHGKRRIAAMSIGTPAMRKKSSAVPQTTEDAVLFSLPEEKQFGKINKRFKVNEQSISVRRVAEATNANLIGAYDIPYINQCTDVPSTSAGGCTAYGPVACAPTTACMVLGYYGLLEKHPMNTGKPWGTVNYSWYVGQPYTSNTGHYFNEIAYGQGCAAQGGYGYMWCRTGGVYRSPADDMGNFITLNGVSGVRHSWNTAIDMIRQESAAGYPYSWCVSSAYTDGHLILPFRADVDYNGGFRSKTGTIVCHDPYGDANCWDGYWAGSDGRHSSYDTYGYNNGYITMGNYWGVVARHQAAVVNPTLDVSPSSLSIATTVGTPKTATFTVTGTNTTGSISISSDNASVISVSPASLAKEGGTVTVTYKPTSTGTHKATITVSSTGVTSKTVSVSGNATYDFKFTEGWNYSETSGKKADWTADFTKLRNMAWGDGKLYVVNSVDGKIHVVNAQTGAHIKDLDMTGVDGGTIKLIDCHFVDGKLIACNLAATGQALKVYVWDNDNSAPRVLLNTNDLGGFARIGDCISVKGNLTNGSLAFACTKSGASSIVTYAITNGTCSTTPTKIALKKDGAVVDLGSSPRAFYGSDKWWAVGASVNPALYKDDGTHFESIPAAATGGVVSGNAFAHIHWQNKSYGLATTYASGSTTLTAGRVSLFAPNPGWREGAQLTEFPSAGLGSTRNTSLSTSIATYNNNDEGLEVWVLVHNQGIAYYKHGTIKTYEIPDSGPGTVNPNPNPNPDPQPSSPDATYGDLKFYYQGGNLNVPADNAALWAAMWEEFKAEYPSLDYAGANFVTPTLINTTLGSSTDPLTETSIGRFLYNNFVQNTNKLNATTSDYALWTTGIWKWLGDYFKLHAADVFVTTSAYTTTTNLSFETQGFLQNKAVKAYGNYPLGNWTEAGNPEAWHPAYIFAHKPTKGNATFRGWFTDAAGTGSALTALPSSGDVYACWKSGVSTDIETISMAYVVPTFDGVEIFFTGTAQVAIYNVNGMMVSTGVATDYYTCNLQAGMYIIRIGDKTYKFVK